MKRIIITLLSAMAFCACGSTPQGTSSNGPSQYIFINDYEFKFNESKISEYFSNSPDSRIAVGAAVLHYIFEHDTDTFTAHLAKHMENAEKYNVPLLVELDPITFCHDVPELWNWFDPSAPGYNDANRENVEWYGWSSDYAVKIGWLNWGRQIRLKPMINLFSPAYQKAVEERMDKFMSLISDWYKSLPKDRKWLLGGVKIIGEFGHGVNNWYYPDGNSLYDKDASEDPVGGIDVNIKPSRGVQTIGYAAAKYSGIKSSGELTGDDIAEIERRFTLFVSEIASRHGLPRELIFAHGGGAGNDLDACLNDMVCPSWSFYGNDAVNGRNATHCMELVKKSDAPWWGAAEWACYSDDPAVWTEYINNMLSIEKCRFISLFCNVIGNNNGTTVNESAVEGIHKVIGE